MLQINYSNPALSDDDKDNDDDSIIDTNATHNIPRLSAVTKNRPHHHHHHIARSEPTLTSASSSFANLTILYFSFFQPRKIIFTTSKK